MVVTTVIEDRMIPCTACDGSGIMVISGMGPVDNMDVWEEEVVCECRGHGYEGIEEVEVLL